MFDYGDKVRIDFPPGAPPSIGYEGGPRHPLNSPEGMEIARAIETPYERKVRNELDSLRAKVSSLYEAIAHGDEAHRAWLKQKLKEHFAP